jgi:molecular chaperone GrpE
MPPSEETSTGPVIHDRRRIDPVTGQVRGKHAASTPAGTTSAGRPADAPGPTGPRDTQPRDTQPRDSQPGDSQPGDDEPADHEPTDNADHEPTDNEDDLEVQEAAEEVLEGILEETVPAGRAQADAEARLAERTADLQRLQAEYANYRKRVDRDRAAMREQAVAGTLAGLLPVLDAIDQAREHGELSGGFKSVADSLQSALGRLGLVTYGEKGDPFDPKIHEALTHSYSPDVAEDTCVEILQPGYKVGDRILRPARVAVAEPATGPDGISNEAAWPSDEGGN